MWGSSSKGRQQNYFSVDSKYLNALNTDSVETLLRKGKEKKKQFQHTEVCFGFTQFQMKPILIL